MNYEVGMIGIVGGSFAGLFAARALALKGWPVTIFEPDEAGDTNDLDRTFDEWNRPGVPQLRQPHTIRALGRKLLLERDPELAADVIGCGAIEWPYGLRKPGVEKVEDPDLVGILARRTSFEPVIRARVEKTPGVTFVRELVTGLLIEKTPVPRVTGLRLRDGSELPFDIVIDASGRRTQVPLWLSQAGIEPPAQQSQPAGMIYYSRYFRFHPGTQAANTTGIRSGPAGTMPLVTFRSNILDRGTFSMTLAVASWEPRFRVLKNDRVFNAYAAAMPSVAAWIDPDASSPISKVRAYGDIFNTHWNFLHGGCPIVRNLFPMGDARVHTSPYFGWGITIALKHAWLLADSFRGPDNEAAQIAFEEAAADFSHAYYEGAAEEDRARTALWKGETLPPNHRYGRYVDLITPAASRDPYVYREVYRRTNMLTRPDEIFAKADIIDRAERAMESGPDPVPSPEQVLERLDSAGKAALQNAQ